MDLQNIYRDRSKDLYIILKKRNLDNAVWKEWNVQDSSLDGSKTRNLSLFVNGLRESVEGSATELKNKGLIENALKYCLGFNRNK